MALLIKSSCTSCDMCLPECPNEAISLAKNIYYIDPERCTECVGHYDEPTCMKVCPINKTIIVDPAHQESQDQLWEKYVLLHHQDKL